MEEVADWLWNLEGDRHRRLGSGVFLCFFSFRFKKGRLFAERVQVSSLIPSKSWWNMYKYDIFSFFFGRFDLKKMVWRHSSDYFSQICVFTHPERWLFFLTKTKGIVPRETRPEAKARVFEVCPGLQGESHRWNEPWNSNARRSQRVGSDRTSQSKGGGWIVEEWKGGVIDFVVVSFVEFQKLILSDWQYRFEKKKDEAFYLAVLFKHIRSL